MPVSEVAEQLRELGIEGGWGSTVGRIRGTMLMLGDIIQAPDPETLQASLYMPYPYSWRAFHVRPGRCITQGAIITDCCLCQEQLKHAGSITASRH